MNVSSSGVADAANASETQPQYSEISRSVMPTSVLNLLACSLSRQLSLDPERTRFFESIVTWTSCSSLAPTSKKYASTMPINAHDTNVRQAYRGLNRYSAQPRNGNSPAPTNSSRAPPIASPRVRASRPAKNGLLNTRKKVNAKAERK